MKYWIYRLWLVSMHAKSLQLCPTHCNPMDSSLPGSSVHEILPERNTGVGCHALLQGIFPPGIEPTSLRSPALPGGFFTTTSPSLSPNIQAECHIQNNQTWHLEMKNELEFTSWHETNNRRSTQKWHPSSDPAVFTPELVILTLGWGGGGPGVGSWQSPGVTAEPALGGGISDQRKRSKD